MGRPFHRPRRTHAPAARSTPDGQHIPVMLAECLEHLGPLTGKRVIDCTLGFGGHSAALLQAVGPAGELIALDLDPANLERARPRLEAVGHPFRLVHTNFAGADAVAYDAGWPSADAVLADLGMSSMQLDDPARGFSLMRDGPLDMRMDPTRGRTAAELLETLPGLELAQAFAELGDEPQAEAIALAIVRERKTAPLRTTHQLRDLILATAPGKVEHVAGRKPMPEWQARIRPAARVFQALRILVNRELANLAQLLRVLPTLLTPGGRVVIIAFHSGEDRLVKQALREGRRDGTYVALSDDPVRPTEAEKQVNPRSRSAKVRWAVRGQVGLPEGG